MTQKQSEKILGKALKKIRKKDSCILAIEEISELLVELNMASIYHNSNCDHLSEEMSDVYITLNLLVGTYGLSRKRINKFKKRNEESFYEYCRGNKRETNIRSAMHELTSLQKLICKVSRGRKVKDKLEQSVGAVELSLEYLQKAHIVQEKAVLKWSDRKMKRMERRIKTGGIV